MPKRVKKAKDIPETAKLVMEEIVNGVTEFIYFEPGEPEADATINPGEELQKNLDRDEKRNRYKREIALIKVVTAQGNEFDADEASQERMARKILVMDDVELINWKLADNTVAQVSKAELAEALKYGMIQQELIILES